jgi:cell division protein ZapA
MESGTPEKQIVRVTILNLPYTLSTAGDPRELEQAAASVNELMFTIADRTSNPDPTRIAVLACLHMADKLHTLERELSSLKDRVDRKSEEFAGMLQQLIEAAGEQ